MHMSQNMMLQTNNLNCFNSGFSIHYYISDIKQLEVWLFYEKVE
jgi:hypothetical protein